MKRFGQYIKEQRQRLGINQDALEGFGQTYISDVELGRKIPARRTTMAKLAAALKLDTSEWGVNWLWTYALFDCPPDEYFGRRAPARDRPALPMLADNQADYQTDATIRLDPGATAQAVVLRLGPPDEIISSGPRSKWMYFAKGVHILFQDGQVTDVKFV